MVSLTSKPAGRTLAEFKPLKPAEHSLLEACRKGEIAEISKQLPEQANAENIVRASFLRFLALGGDEHAPIHEKGVLVSGAWVEDQLSLESAYLPHNLWLCNCRLSNILMPHSNVRGSVSFPGCHVNSFAADGIVCSGGIFLNDGFTSFNSVRLPNAQISGNLECTGGHFNSTDDALFCDRAVIKGSVFLDNGFTATGSVRLLAAQIDGSLKCCKAQFKNPQPDEIYGGALLCNRASIKGDVFLNDGFTANGLVGLLGTQIGGNVDFEDATLDNLDGIALLADGMTVTGALYFRKLRSFKGKVSLSASKVGSLADDGLSWPKEGLVLDGFIYDRLTGNAPTNATIRLAWLDKQLAPHAGLASHGNNFKPQPWRQLQKVLHEMGHDEDARKLAIAFEDRLRKANLIGQTPETWCKPIAWLYRTICRCFHWNFGIIVGYGYRPLRLFFIMLAIWLACGAFYWYAALDGVFSPSNPLVFQHQDYDVCKADNDKAKTELAKQAGSIPPPVQGAGNWYLCANLREEYTGFSPLAYSLDLILPLVDLQQEQDWAPMIPTPKNTWTDELLTWSAPKHCTRFLIWFEILFGWVASLLLVAIVSGLAKRREE